MAGLVPAIHVLLLAHKEDVDARDKRGHDESRVFELQSVGDLIHFDADSPAGKRCETPLRNSSPK